MLIGLGSSGVAGDARCLRARSHVPRVLGGSGCSCVPRVTGGSGGSTTVKGKEGYSF